MLSLLLVPYLCNSLLHIWTVPKSNLVVCGCVLLHSHQVHVDGMKEACYSLNLFGPSWQKPIAASKPWGCTKFCPLQQVFTKASSIFNLCALTLYPCCGESTFSNSHTQRWQSTLMFKQFTIAVCSGEGVFQRGSFDVWEIPVHSIILVLTVTKDTLYLILTKEIPLYKWVLEPSCFGLLGFFNVIKFCCVGLCALGLVVLVSCIVPLLLQYLISLPVLNGIISGGILWVHPLVSVVLLCCQQMDHSYVFMLRLQHEIEVFNITSARLSQWNVIIS